MTKGDAAPGETNMFANVVQDLLHSTPPAMNEENRKLAQHLGRSDFEQRAFDNPDKPGEVMDYAEMRARYG